MKECDECHAKNATRARFCSSCGAPFTELELADRSLPTVRPAARPETDRISDATSEFASTLGASLLAITVATGRFLARLARPLVHFLLGLARDMVLRALAPASTWDRTRTPNFLYWGLFEALLWRLPTGVVGLVYAILANDARRNGDYDVALRRAESARAWLVVDFAVGAALLVAKGLLNR